MIEQRIISECREALRSLYGQEVLPEQVGLEKTKREIGGDFTIVVFPFTRYSRKSPEITAAEIGEFLKTRIPDIDSFQVIKGFLNLTLSDGYWARFLRETAQEEDFGMIPQQDIPPVVVEFSSPNTNKPLHLGHIRNNLLGWSVSRILEANGYPVKKVNLVNDRGIHICKSLLAYMKWGHGETPASSGKKGDHLVGEYYVAFDRHYKDEVKVLMEKGISEDHALRQAPLMLEAQEILRLWEAKDPEVMKLWHTMNGWTYEGFDETYDKLGISFDKIYYESETYLLGKELVTEGLEKGVLFRKEDGSVWMDLTADGLDQKLLLRSDGTSVYMTQDLGTASLRYDDFHPSKMIYVVGNEQNYHFDVLKLVLAHLGKEYADHIYHLSYGMVELPHGRMKSREGTVVDADDLVAEMYATAEETTRELGKVNDFPDEEAAELFRILGLGALKYFILKVDPKKNMLFDPKESIDFNGNTGPFIQYTHARINSLLQRAAAAGKVAELQDMAEGNVSLLPREREVLRLLQQFPGVIRQAGDELSPAMVANYVYDLAKTYNQFYQEIPVLKEEDETLVSLRLAISRCTGKVILTAMDLLGIEVPYRM